MWHTAAADSVGGTFVAIRFRVVRSQVLTAADVKMAVFWVVAPFSLV
jgi:hypothetical protein